MGNTKDFWLFFKRNDCTIDGDLEMFASLVRLRVNRVTEDFSEETTRSRSWKNWSKTGT